LHSLFEDTKLALRLLGKNPGFAAVAVVTLALGIGANTAMFSVVHSVLLKPLPYPASDRLVSVSAASFLHSPSRRCGCRGCLSTRCLSRSRFKWVRATWT
jgi:hypothetical protein